MAEVSLGEVVSEASSGSIRANELLSVEAAHRAASKYLELGWAVTAGPGVGLDGVCACKSGTRCKTPGKHAHGGWGEPDRRVMNLDMVNRYWSAENSLWKKQPVDQVFIVPYLSGLVVADVDNMDKWWELDPALRPETLYSVSGSGRGGHFFFQYVWDTSEEAPSLPGKLPGGAGELKFRGIVAAAPSVHWKGGRYTWANWGCAVAELPTGLMKKRELVGRKEIEYGSVLRRGAAGAGVDWQEVMYFEDLAGIESAAAAKTGRPVVLFAVAAKMSKWIDAGWITEESVLERLYWAAGVNGCLEDYGEAELGRQFKNALDAGRGNGNVEE